MKRLRKHSLFLLVIALALPLGMAFLHYDFLADNDLASRMQISKVDEKTLLSFQREDLKISDSVVHLPQSLIIVSGINPFFSSDVIPALPGQSHSILRC